ncbi:MAG: M48 family metallopeptidase [Oceanospirillales bacterium]|uniref:Peptidase M48-like protein n=1 Tax=Marinobacterium halophilum TaxID=267374 RepID=A0A2P8EII7_9GAMM|nr:M48 family metallopeptidase [Marinobacterium halophilum]MBR9827121.1 M48 family metallopeptidase [Oceanospirillales bacterium]PSL09272.1 peptidase M48-like protein [Marinobacterium halophilum]
MFAGMLKRTGLVACLSLTAAGCAVSPTGEKTLLLNSPSQMNSLGSQSFEQMKEKTPIENDARINRYVQCVADAIVMQVPSEYGYTPSDWELIVFKDDAVNAFALPGGKMGVYTGMLQVADNQHQLASVIGHEVSHVLAQHSNARMSQQQLTQLGMAATSIVLADRVDSKTQQAAIMALGLGAQYGILLPYSRQHESEADTLGQELMAKAGFDPREAVALWQKMAQKGGATPPELLSTHPAPGTRIQQLDRQVQRYMPLYQQAQAAGRRPNCERLKPR